MSEKHRRIGREIGTQTEAQDTMIAEYLDLVQIGQVGTLTGIGHSQPGGQGDRSSADFGMLTGGEQTLLQKTAD